MASSPSLWDLFALLENSPKPVIAAINGWPRRGLEMAIVLSFTGCRRVGALGAARVKLGLLPGAGGTQTPATAGGRERALNMIGAAIRVRARELAVPLCWMRHGRDVLVHGRQFAGRVIAEKLPLKKARDIKIDLPNADAFLAFSRSAVAPLAKNYPAPLKCIAAVRGRRAQALWTKA